MLWENSQKVCEFASFIQPFGGRQQSHADVETFNASLAVCEVSKELGTILSIAIPSKERQPQLNKVSLIANYSDRFVGVC